MNSTGTHSSGEVFAQLELLLARGTDPTLDEVRAAHDGARSVIRKINERLANAHRLIVAGRRTEAIEIAEGPPDIMDEIAIWDTSLIHDWNFWSSHFGLPPLDLLRTDWATALSGAYAAERQLEHLLRRHRLLAIGRANLRQRIAVLSQLAAADPSNPQWNRALAECQRRRLEQLAQRAAAGRKQDDLACLQQVAEELRQTRWLTASAKTQLNSLQKQIKRLRNRQATTEAIALAEHIKHAFSFRDSARVDPLVKYWKKIEPNVDPAVLADELPGVRPALEWFEENAAARRKSEAEPTAADSSADSSADTTGDAAVAAVSSATQPKASSETPAATRVRETYVRRAAAERRSRQWKAGLITTAVVAVVLAGAFWLNMTYRSYQREATLTKMLVTIDRQLTKGELAAADELLSSVPTDDERFEEVRSRLQEQQQAEERRAAQFDADVTAIASAIEDTTQVDTFDSLTRGISELASRAKNDEEQEAAAQLSRQLRIAREQRKTVVMDQARQLIVKIRDGLNSLQPDDDARSVLAQWNLQLLKTRTDRWIRAETALLDELEATSEAVADRREAIRAMAKQQRP